MQKLLLALAATCLSANLFAMETKELADAKAEYMKAPFGSESARLQYVDKLASMLRRYSFHMTGVQADAYVKEIESELRAHPAPKTIDAEQLRDILLSGNWKSVRHDCQYNSDGSYLLLPEVKGEAPGQWRIESNRYIDAATAGHRTDERYTIAVLNDRYFIYFDKKDMVFNSRVAKTTNGSLPKTASRKTSRNAL